MQAPGLLRDVIVLEFEGFAIARKVSASCDPDVGPGDSDGFCGMRTHKDLCQRLKLIMFPRVGTAGSFQQCLVRLCPCSFVPALCGTLKSGVDYGTVLSASACAIWVCAVIFPVRLPRLWEVVQPSAGEHRRLF